MHISHAEIRCVRLPLVHGFQTSSHRKKSLDHLVVTLHGENGYMGWGEIASASHPFYNPETTETCWSIATAELLPLIVGRTWNSAEQASGAWNKVRGNHFAKAGVEMALWDLQARLEHRSVADLLGGTRSTVAAGVSLGIEPSIGELLDQVALQLEAGYTRVKLKVAPGWDVKPVSAVRREFGDIDLHVDANASFSEIPAHLGVLHELDGQGLTMIEQPFAPENLLAHARLQQQIETPICLDESVESLASLETALSIDACRVLNIKVSRMGGLGAARAAHDLAVSAGIPVWCGGMHEFGIGRAANIAISSLPGFTLTSDVSASEKYYARDILTRPITADRGIVEVPVGDGLGYDVDLVFLAENTLRIQTLEPATSPTAA